MRRIAEDLLQLNKRRDDIPPENDMARHLVGHRSMGLCMHQLGEFASARRHFERVLDLYVPQSHHSLASIAAYDMQAVALSYLPLDLLILGYPERAAQWIGQSPDWSRSMRHPHNLAFSLTYAAILDLLRRDDRAAERVLGELIALASNHRFPVWLAQAHIMQGYMYTMSGKTVEGLELARKGFADRAATQSIWN